MDDESDQINEKNLNFENKCKVKITKDSFECMHKYELGSFSQITQNFLPKYTPNKLK